MGVPLSLRDPRRRSQKRELKRRKAKRNPGITLGSGAEFWDRFWPLFNQGRDLLTPEQGTD